MQNQLGKNADGHSKHFNKNWGIIEKERKKERTTPEE